MIYVSRMGAQELVIRPKRKSVDQVAGQKIISLDPGLKVRFTPLVEGFPTRRLPVQKNDQKARGVLYTDRESTRLRIKENELVKILDSHPGNVANGGSDFVRADYEERIVEPDDVIQPAPGGMWHCTVCDKVMDPRGRLGHINGKLHAANLDKADAKARYEREGVL